jgi:hypothetical protein
MIFATSFTLFWAACSYLCFARAMAFWCAEFRTVGNIDNDFRETLFMAVVGGAMAMIASFMSFGFKHGMNWRKEMRIKRGVLAIDEFKRNG